MHIINVILKCARFFSPNDLTFVAFCFYSHSSRRPVICTLRVNLTYRAPLAWRSWRDTVLLETIHGWAPRIKPLIGARNGRSYEFTELAERQNRRVFQFFSVYYLLRRVKRSVFTGGDFEYTDEYTARSDARTRSEPVPAWCRCNDGTHFFLCIGYFRFHDTSDRFDTKRAWNARPMCHPGGRDGCQNSQDSRKFYSQDSSDCRERDSSENNFSGTSVLP